MFKSDKKKLYIVIVAWTEIVLNLHTAAESSQAEGRYPEASDLAAMNNSADHCEVAPCVTVMTAERQAKQRVNGRCSLHFWLISVFGLNIFKWLKNIKVVEEKHIPWAYTGKAWALHKIMKRHRKEFRWITFYGGGKLCLRRLQCGNECSNLFHNGK